MKNTKFESSTFIESVPDQSFRNQHSLGQIIYQQAPPLHACYAIYLKKDNSKTILKPIHNPTNKKTKNSSHKPIFGCSQSREDVSFLSRKNSIVAPGPGAYQRDSSFCQNSLSKSSKQKERREKQNWKLGFNIGCDLKRLNYLSSRSKNGPGPGHYEIKRDFSQKILQTIKVNVKRLLPQEEALKKQKPEKNACTYFRQLSHPQHSILVPGPGAYDIYQNSQCSPRKIREHWRTKIKERLLHKDSLRKSSKLAQIGKYRLKSDYDIEEMGESRMKDNKNEILKTLDVVKQENKQDKQNFDKKKMRQANLIRKQLAGQTAKFLPNLFSQQTQFRQVPSLENSHINRPSNCFLLKNDHAYESYMQKQKQQESQYYFFPGKQNKYPKAVKQSYMFTSIGKRTLFA